MGELGLSPLLIVSTNCRLCGGKISPFLMFKLGVLLPF